MESKAYPVPAPEPTQYPPPGLQQYPPPPQYPPMQPGYGISQYVAAPTTQQEPQVVVVSAYQQPVIVQQAPSYVGHIVFACFVFWCCNCLCGLIAFILAS